MTTVNITPKTVKIAESEGLFVERGVQTIFLNNGTERQRDVIEIGEEVSDFLIVYGVGADGSLYLITKPGYVEDLPAHIDSGVKLRDVVQFATNEAKK